MVTGRVFKYEADLEQVPDCPPLEALERVQAAFRFVFDPIGSTSFVPQGKDPTRLASQRTPRCSYFGLSLYDSERNARAAFEPKVQDRPQLRNLIGSDLAQVMLRPEHGVQTTTRDNGHFTLYEYVGVDLAAIAVKIGSL